MRKDTPIVEKDRRHAKAHPPMPPRPRPPVVKGPISPFPPLDDETLVENERKRRESLKKPKVKPRDFWAKEPLPKRLGDDQIWL